MTIKIKKYGAQCSSLLLLLVFVFDAAAAPRGQCNANMIVTDLQTLSFGNYVGDVGGVITIDINGGRSESGGVSLVGGGTVSAGLLQVTSGIAGCSTYPISITYRGNPRLTGAGSNMPLSNFKSSEVSEAFYVGNAAGDSVDVSFGADLATPTSQTGGPYTGTYRVTFKFEKP